MKKILSATISLLLFALAGGEPAADVPLNSSGELQFGDARFRIAVFGSTWHENNNRQWRELNVTELPSGRELSAVLDVDDTPADIRGTLKLSGAKLATTWQLAFPQARKIRGAFGGLMIPAALTTRFEINGRPFTLPAEYRDGDKWQHIFYQARQVKLEYAAGKILTISTPAPVRLVVQDNRRWKQQQFDLRFFFTPAEGEVKTATLRLDFTREEISSSFADLKKQMNRGFADPPGATVRGWTAQGPENDLSALKPGTLSCGKLEFRLVDPAANGGRSVLALGGERREGLPQSVTVPLHLPSGARVLNLLHATAWTPQAGKQIGTITVTDADRTKQQFPVFSGNDVGNWWAPRSLPNGEVIWEAENSSGRVGLYASSFPLRGTPVAVTFTVRDPAVAWLIPALTFTSYPVNITTPAEDFTPKAGGEFLVLDYRGRVLPGSPLDFSFLQPEAPAGKYGRIVPAPDGTFTFADAPGRRLRLFGVNLCFSANFPAREEADAFAENLLRCGYNSVRFHHADIALEEFAGNSSLDWKAGLIDRFDYLLAALKKRGIYVTIDFYSTRTLQRGDQITEVTNYNFTNFKEFKALIPFVPAVMENWKACVRRWMTHRNPHTGLTWAEDPAIYCANLVNEDSLKELTGITPKVRAVIAAAFREWKTRNRCPKAEMNFNDARFCRFVAARQSAAHAEMIRFLREELHSDILLTSINCFEDRYLSVIRNRFDLVDNHLYHDHPASLAKSWSYPRGYLQKSAISLWADVPGRLMPTRIFGKPFVVTEYNFCPPNLYRSEAGPLMGAYAALQNWDGLYRFAWSHQSETLNTPRTGAAGFDINGDPIARLTDRLTAAMFLRGDLQSAPRQYAFHLRTDQLFRGGNAPASPLPRPFRRLGLIARIGTVVDDSPAGGAELLSGREAISPNAIAHSGDAAAWQKAVNSGPAVSSTGEIKLDPAAGTFVVAAPKTESISTARGSITGNFLTLARVNSFLTVGAIALDDRPLRDSSRILLLHLTDVINSDAVFGNRRFTVVKKPGGLPLLLRRGSCRIRLNTPNTYRITALSADGASRGNCEGRSTGRAFEFTADNGRFPGGVMAYLLERKQ